MVDEYILHGVSDMDLKNISFSSNHGVSTYTLSANKNFSIFFEVFTAAGPVNVSHDTFSKTTNGCVYTSYREYCIQQPMMSRVCQWKRKKEEECQ